MSEAENQNYLENVVNNSSVKLCKRLRSVERLQNETVLKSVVEQATDPSLRKKAILNSNMDSQEFLKGREEVEENQGVLRTLRFKLDKLENHK